MPARRFRPLARLGLPLLLTAAMGLSGCDTLLDSRYQSSVPPGSGVERLQGVAKGAEIRRNSLGMPLISSDNLHDAIFALGYTHAGDRLSQMVGMRLMAEGRLAEMIGPGAVEIDRFMRTVNLKAASENLYRGASPQIRNTLEVYARGVNAYLYRYRDNLPMDLAESGFTVPWWKPEDSVLIFTLLNFGLSMNLQEEIAALVMAQQVGTEQLAWLMPIHPDEPLPFEEAERLKGLDLHGRISGLSQVAAATRQVADLDMLGVAASNNWAIAPAMSKGGKSLLANDTHLPLSLPSTWNYVQISTPKYRAAGVSIAGIPLVVAGFNGKLAWGMTMVMGDTQDLFLEQLKQENGQLLYLADGIWQPTRQRHETFIIKGAKPLREVIHETRNGPLLNSALGQRKHPLQPLQIDSSLGLALRSISMENDQSIDAFFNLTRAQSVEQAHEQVRNIRAISLNMLYADADNIAWQVTGRYPNRLAGRGLLPAPGWDSQYAWDGYADPMLHPYDQNPAQGWLGSANQRSVAPGYAVQLSSSWYYPERAERIAQLAAAGRHDTQSMIDMQYDQTSPFVPKLQAMLKGPFMQQPLQQAIDALPAGERQQAQAALQRLLAFNARLDPTSADAALYGAFLQESAKEIFLDELGPPDSPAWLALVDSANMSYSAQADHLLGRDDSPFWDDRRTPQVENKPAILARSLVLAQAFCEQQLGTDPGKWQWGKLHSYTWASDATQMAHLMSPAQQAGISALSSYLDRGPYPAGGDHSTLNVSAYHWGKNFDTWLIPAMRLIVDFNRDEPMLAMNSSGQSGNPASPHYADGIQAWLQGDYMSFPMQPANQEKVYGKAGLLLLPGK